jgi:hypothetical protein
MIVSCNPSSLLTDIDEPGVATYGRIGKEETTWDAARVLRVDSIAA